MNLWLLAVAMVAAPAETTGPDTVVVCPPTLEAALRPWLEHRRQQGHAIALVSPTGTPDEIRARIRQAAVGGDLRFVVLVGPGRAVPASIHEATVRPADRMAAPPALTAARAIGRWGGAARIATDNWYADLNGDGLADVAIGRLPAETPQQLAALVRKILAYENNADFGPWRSRINFVAGSGGFGVAADAALERLAARLITHGVPPQYRTTMTYASWPSPFCPDPRRFRDVARQRLGEGALFWVYIGHGGPRELVGVQLSREFGWDTILAADDCDRLTAAPGLPVAVLLACHSGAYHAPQQCLAEAWLHSPQGPVAVLASSQVAMPLGMAAFSRFLLAEAFEHRRVTLGEIVLHGKRRLRAADATPATESLLVAASRSFRSLPDGFAPWAWPAWRIQAIKSVGGLWAAWDDQRGDHAALFNLLGDPLLRLAYPLPLALHAAPAVGAPGRVLVRGDSPIDGPLRVELHVRRDQPAAQLGQRRWPSRRDEVLAGYDHTYEQANSTCLASVETAVVNGAFEVVLEVPQPLEGPCYVRAEVSGAAAFALGAVELPPRDERR